MLIKTNPSLQVYRVYGSLAALIDERAWEIMLRGEAVLIMEPDTERWTLFKDLVPIDSIKAETPEEATMIWSKKFIGFGNDVYMMAMGRDPILHWGIEPGYPNYLTCDREQRLAHERAGRDTAKKIADHYRNMVQEGIKGTIVQEELRRFGMKKEGKD